MVHKLMIGSSTTHQIPSKTTSTVTEVRCGRNSNTSSNQQLTVYHTCTVLE